MEKAQGHNKTQFLDCTSIKKITCKAIRKASEEILQKLDIYRMTVNQQCKEIYIRKKFQDFYIA